MTTLSYNKAVMAMHKPDARLIQTNGVKGTVWGITPCGHAVTESVAAKIIARPDVEGGKDSLFPHMDQTWRLRATIEREMKQEGPAMTEKPALRGNSAIHDHITAFFDDLERRMDLADFYDADTAFGSSLARAMGLALKSPKLGTLILASALNTELMSIIEGLAKREAGDDRS
jgi:hypothetical protein